jgi:uncharacterized protein (DUF302 family)
MVEYGETLELPERDFSSVVEDVERFLEEEGFGVLTEINVQETLKKKLDVDVEKYRILGACAPDRAHKALQAEKEIGLLLPCNVIVFEEDGVPVVGVMRPTQVMSLAGNDALDEVAADVEESMDNVLAKLENS